MLLPGVRLQTMLMKNHEAVAELVADLYRRNGEKRAVINGIVDEELSKMISRMGSGRAGRHRVRLFQQRCTGPGIVGIPHL